MLLIKLSELLNEKGISQRELSRLTGIRHPTINEMCLNKSKYLPVSNLELICNTLECDISDLLEIKKEHSD